MVSQYPHQLWASPSAAPQQDAKGRWLPQVADWQFVSVCREQVGGRGTTITLPDGKVTQTTSVVHLPLSCPNLAPGMAIQVRSGGDTVRREATVVSFDAGQLHKRLWS